MIDFIRDPEDIGQPEIVQLAYTSIARPTIDEDELIEILKESRVRNLKYGVTGMLVYRDGRFMQVLEGPKCSVEYIYSKIATDKERHYGLVQTFYEIIEDRDFEDWRMGFSFLGENREESLPKEYRDILSESEESVFDRVESEPHLAVQLLKTFTLDDQGADTLDL